MSKEERPQLWSLTDRTAIQTASKTFFKSRNTEHIILFGRRQAGFPKRAVLVSRSLICLNLLLKICAIISEWKGSGMPWIFCFMETPNSLVEPTQSKKITLVILNASYESSSCYRTQSEGNGTGFVGSSACEYSPQIRSKNYRSLKLTKWCSGRDWSDLLDWQPTIFQLLFTWSWFAWAFLCQIHDVPSPGAFRIKPNTEDLEKHAVS